jgi:hypothetical protein
MSNLSQFKKSIPDLRQDVERLRRLGELQTIREQIGSIAMRVQGQLRQAAAADDVVLGFNSALAAGRLDEEQLVAYSDAHVRAGQLRDEASRAGEQIAQLSGDLSRKKNAFVEFDRELMQQARAFFHEAYSAAILCLAEKLRDAEVASAAAHAVWEQALDQFGFGGDPGRGLGEWHPPYGGLIREDLPFFREDSAGSSSDFYRWIDDCRREGFLADVDAQKLKVA